VTRERDNFMQVCETLLKMVKSEDIPKDILELMYIEGVIDANNELIDEYGSEEEE